MHPEEDGFVLHDPRDSRALGEILRRILMDTEFRQRVAGRGVVTAQTLTWQNTAEHVRACWNQALGFKDMSHRKE